MTTSCLVLQSRRMFAYALPRPASFVFACRCGRTLTYLAVWIICLVMQNIVNLSEGIDSSYGFLNCVFGCSNRIIHCLFGQLMKNFCRRWRENGVNERLVRTSISWISDFIEIFWKVFKHFDGNVKILKKFWKDCKIISKNLEVLLKNFKDFWKKKKPFETF